MFRIYLLVYLSTLIGCAHYKMFTEIDIMQNAHRSDRKTELDNTMLINVQSG